MIFLKHRLFFLLVLCLIGFSSCDDDSNDPCVAPEASTNIVGSWNVQNTSGNIEFRADGTLIDTNNALIGPVELNGEIYDQKSWSVNGTTLTLTAMPSSGTGDVSLDFNITENSCDEINIEFFTGNPQILIRL